MKVVISCSINKDVVDKLVSMAKKENRNVSNMVESLIYAEMERRENGEKMKLPINEK